MHTTRTQICQFIVENFLFGRQDDLPADDESLLEAGIVDSTGVLELVGFLERQYGIAVEDHELLPSNLDSIACIVRFIEQKRLPESERLVG